MRHFPSLGSSGHKRKWLHVGLDSHTLALPSLGREKIPTYITVDGRTPANHLGRKKPCKHWDRPTNLNCFSRRLSEASTVWTLDTRNTTKFPKIQEWEAASITLTSTTTYRFDHASSDVAGTHLKPMGPGSSYQTRLLTPIYLSFVHLSSW